MKYTLIVLILISISVSAETAQGMVNHLNNVFAKQAKDFKISDKVTANSTTAFLVNKMIVIVYRYTSEHQTIDRKVTQTGISSGSKNICDIFMAGKKDLAEGSTMKLTHQYTLLDGTVETFYHYCLDYNKK